MNEREYERLRRQIEDEYQHKATALATVWGLANPGEPLPKWPPVKADETPESRTPRGQASAAIVSAVGRLGPEFTSSDVAKLLEESAPSTPRSTISHTLKRMVEDGRLVCLEAGEGKRPGRFRVAGVESPPLTTNDVCSTELRESIRALARSTEIDPNEFRTRFLSPFNVDRIGLLTTFQAEVVLSQIQKFAKAMAT